MMLNHRLSHYGLLDRMSLSMEHVSFDDSKRGENQKPRVVHSKFIPEYEHLDVLWAIDAIEQVGREVKEVIWRTASEEGRKKCRVPEGCEHVEPWTDDR